MASEVGGAGGGIFGANAAVALDAGSGVDGVLVGLFGSSASGVACKVLALVFPPAYEYAQLPTVGDAAGITISKGQEGGRIAKRERALHQTFPFLEVVLGQLSLGAGSAANAFFGRSSGWRCGGPARDVGVDAAQCIGIHLHALAEVFNQTDGLSAAHAGLGVGQRAHLYAEDAEDAQCGNDDGNQRFQQSDALLFAELASVIQLVHGTSFCSMTRIRPPEDMQMPLVAAEAIPAG